MTHLTFESVPGFLQTMDERLRNIENSLVSKVQPQQDTSKTKRKLPDAAKYCNMAVPTFRTYLYKRKIAGSKFGKSWLFLESDLDKFIDDHRRPTANELKTKAFEKLISSKRGGSK